jgi:hypothetical protein
MPSGPPADCIRPWRIAQPITRVRDDTRQPYSSPPPRRAAPQNTSRVYFVSHRGGYVFPAKINVRPNGDAWSAVCEELPTTMSFIWFTGAETGWRITAVCKSALSLLNVDLPAMRAGTLSIATHFPDIQGVIMQVREPPRCLRCCELIQHAALSAASRCPPSPACS